MWSSPNVPTSVGDPGSWQQQNPNWKYCFWDDQTLRAFMADHFPDLLPLFDAYPKKIQQADLGRYCLLSHFGGVYADIDTRCLTSVEPLAGVDRIVLCEEPREHQHHALRRGMQRLVFNGTMASPPGHPFWSKVFDLCRLMHSSRDGDVIETTGPILLSAAVADWPKQEDFLLHSSHLFAERPGASTPPYFGRWSDVTFSEHYWNGSWIRRRKTNIFRHMVTYARRRIHEYNNDNLDLEDIRRTIDPVLLHATPQSDAELPTIAILIPVRNGAATLGQNFEQILNLDYPKNRLHLIYGEGDSSDGTSEALARLIDKHGATFAGISSITTQRNSPHVEHHIRYAAGLASLLCETTSCVKR